MSRVEEEIPLRKAAPQTARGASPHEQFTALLNNAGKGRTRPGVPVRERGFVALVGNAASLQLVQEWCLRQTWNDCLTARYRIESGPVFGTLLVALAADLDRVRGDARGLEPAAAARLAGDVRFDRSRGWGGFLAELPDEPGLLLEPREEPRGTLGAGDLEAYLRELARDWVLPTGRRLVVLAEVVGEPDPAEWELARSELFPRLPERVGLVLAGAPPGFGLPPGDPHYLELDLAGVDPGEPPEEAYVYEPAALDSDRPAHEDRLNLGRYAQALARLLLHPGTGPMTVAIHGPWGKGKSSFMAFVRRALVDVAVESDAAVEPASERAARRRLRESERKVVAIEFNAWRYEDSTQIWAGLASAVTSRLEEALPWWRRRATPLAYAWHRHRAELLLELLVPALAATLLVALAALGVPRLAAWVETQVASDALAQLLGAVLPGAGAVLAAVWILGTRVRRALQPVSTRVLTYVRRPDYRERMGYQHLVLEDIRFVHGRLRRSRPDCRTFVFIDDLDRCLPEKVVAILQAINLVLGESEFYVLLGIDTAMIHRAIETHYATNDGPPLPPRFGETYLQKIVQLPFHLPATSPAERAEFVGHLFSEAARRGVETVGVEPERGGPAPAEATGGLRLAWSRDVLLPPVAQVTKPVEDTPVELRAFLDFQESIADNPRELKRLVNVHRFAKIVLQQEGRPVAEDTQRKLVKWLVFCARWPDYCDDVLERARSDPGSASPIADAAGGLDPDAAAFAARLEPADVLSAQDLAPDGPLARAAMISQLVVWDERRPS